MDSTTFGCGSSRHSFAELDTTNSGGLVGALQAFTGAPRKNVFKVLTVHLNIIVYAAAYWASAQVLPFRTKQLGASAVMFGYLQTSFALVQLLGGPVIGRLCDSKGARLAIQLAQFFSGVSYLLLGAADTVPMLFLSRLPTVFMQTMHAAQAFITDFTPSQSRAAALGRLSLSYGIGQVIGSASGGFLVDVVGLTGVAYIAGALSISICFLNAVVLPEGRSTAASDSAGDGKKKEKQQSSGMNFSRILDLLKEPTLRSYMLFQVLLGLAVSTYYSMFSFSVSERLGMQPADLGSLQAVGAVVGVIVNTFLVGALVKRLGEVRVLQLACVVFTLCFLAFSQVTEKMHLFVLSVPFGFAGAIYYTVATSILTLLVAGDDTGTAIGFSHATRSGCGIVSPTIGGYLLAMPIGFPALGLFSASVTAAALAFLTSIQSRIITAFSNKDKKLS